MKQTLLVLISFSLISCQSNKEDAPMKKILMAVTSIDSFGSQNKETGAYITEITHPYEVFKKAGYEIDFVSPKGGKTPLDGMNEIDEASKKLLKDKDFLSKLHTAMKPSDINFSDYQAIFYAGGHGTMFDFPDNEKLQKISAQIYEEGGVVSAVCHGPSALVNIKLKDGSYLVSEKEVAAFTNEEEEAVKLTKKNAFFTRN